MGNKLSEDIRNALSPYYPISKETANALVKHTQKRELEAGEIIEKENCLVKSEMVILEGTVRSFIHDSEGNEITTNFFQKGKAITPTLMRTLDDTAFYSLQAITDTILLEFDKAGMFQDMDHFKDLEMFGYRVMMVDASHRAEKEVVMLKCSGKEKLEWFRKNYPNFENEIPHYYIASFLGMTPTSLSRLRSK